MTVRTDETSHDGTGDRPLRRDAERNRQRILAAAADVLTERGLARPGTESPNSPRPRLPSATSPTR